MIKAKDITTRLVREEVRKYNRMVNKFRKKGGVYELLEPIEIKEVISGRTNAEIARELNFLNKIKDPKSMNLVKYSKDSNIKVPRFVRETIERNIKRANELIKNEEIKEQAESRYDKNSKIKMEPLSKGSGSNLKSIKSRARTAKNRANVNWYRESDENFKRNWISMVQQTLGPYGTEIINKVNKIPANKFYKMTTDYWYGGALELGYLYGPDEAREKAENIFDALDHFGY